MQREYSFELQYTLFGDVIEIKSPKMQDCLAGYEEPSWAGTRFCME